MQSTVTPKPGPRPKLNSQDEIARENAIKHARAASELTWLADEQHASAGKPIETGRLIELAQAHSAASVAWSEVAQSLPSGTVLTAELAGEVRRLLGVNARRARGDRS